MGIGCLKEKNNRTRGTFRPEERITREQMAVMISRAIKASGKTTTAKASGDESRQLAVFRDAHEISSSAQGAVAQTTAAGIV